MIGKLVILLIALLKCLVSYRFKIKSSLVAFLSSAGTFFVSNNKKCCNLVFVVAIFVAKLKKAFLYAVFIVAVLCIMFFNVVFKKVNYSDFRFYKLLCLFGGLVGKTLRIIMREQVKHGVCGSFLAGTFSHYIIL